jgi:hypothetical protein
LLNIARQDYLLLNLCITLILIEVAYSTHGCFTTAQQSALDFIYRPIMTDSSPFFFNLEPFLL